MLFGRLSPESSLLSRDVFSALSVSAVKISVVVRLLPPSVTEEELVALLSDSALKEKIAWSRFFPGRQG